jgi:uncharacterized protein (TIGR03435 family)
MKMLSTLTKSAVAAVVSMAVLVVLLAATPRRLRAQAPTNSADQPKFDAASVKPNHSAGPETILFQPGGHLVTSNLPARVLITMAYGLQSGEGYHAMIGAPRWIDSARFDIEAKAHGNPSIDEMRLMLRSLLADRFKLLTHYETRQLPVYALELSKAGKTGPQLVPHAADNSTCRDLKAQPWAPPQPGIASSPAPIPCGGGWMVSPGHIATESTTARLAKNLSWFQQIDRAVIDKTGLSGTFDITIDYIPFVSQPGADVATSDSSAPSSIFTALKEQLGLRMSPQTGPVDVLVIDHVEEPSPN